MDWMSALIKHYCGSYWNSLRMNWETWICILIPFSFLILFRGKIWQKSHHLFVFSAARQGFLLSLTLDQMKMNETRINIVRAHHHSRFVTLLLTSLLLTRGLPHSHLLTTPRLLMIQLTTGVSHSLLLSTLLLFMMQLMMQLTIDLPHSILLSALLELIIQLTKGPPHSLLLGIILLLMVKLTRDLPCTPLFMTLLPFTVHRLHRLVLWSLKHPWNNWLRSERKPS